MPTTFVSLTPESLDRDAQPSQKRKRGGGGGNIRVVCGECRRKKMKCDRELPCGQCSKSKEPERCSYQTDQLLDPDLARHDAVPAFSPAIKPAVKPYALSHARAVSDSHEPPRPPADPADPPFATTARSLSVGHALERPVVTKESLASPTSPLRKDPPPLPPPLPLDDREELATAQCHRTARKDPSGLGVKGPRTRYYGPGHWKHLISEFPELSSFFKTYFTDPNIVSLRREFERIQKRQPKKKVSKTQHTLQPLAELLPHVDACDKLVQLYFDNFEVALRILHRPSFTTDFAQFRQTPQAYAADKHREVWVAQLLMVMAIGFSIETPRSCLPGGGDAQVDKWVDSVQLWLRSLKNTRMTEFAVLQAGCLFLLAHQLRYIKRDILSMETSSLVRAAMMAGLQRDPGTCSHITPAQVELRRRLWVTYVQLDIVAALFSGLPPVVRHGDFDCQPPGNFDDASLGAVPAPASEMTESTLQRTRALAIPVQLQILQLIYREGARADYARVLELDREFRFLYPPWGYDGTGVRAPADSWWLPEVLWDTYRHRTLMFLHRPFAVRAGTQPAYAYSRQVCVESALAHLDHQTREATSDAAWHLHGLFRDDYMQSALHLCLELKMIAADLTNRMGQHGAGNLGYMHTALARQSLEHTVQQSLDRFVKSGMHLHGDVKNALFLALALGGVMAAGPPELAMRSAAKKITKDLAEHMLPPPEGNAPVAPDGDTPRDTTSSTTTTPASIQMGGDVLLSTTIALPPIADPEYAFPMDWDIDGFTWAFMD